VHRTRTNKVFSQNVYKRNGKKVGPWSENSSLSLTIRSTDRKRRERPGEHKTFFVLGYYLRYQIGTMT